MVTSEGSGRTPRIYYPGRDFLSSIEKAGIYVFRDMIKPFWRWLLLFLLMLIPVIRLLPFGMLLRATVRKERIRLEDDGAFGKGFGLWVITIIYVDTPLILISILDFLCERAASAGSDVLIGKVTVVLLVLLLLMNLLFYIPGIVNYARNSFGYAFHFRENLRMIEEAGWKRYLGTVGFLALLVFCFIMGIWGISMGVAAFASTAATIASYVIDLIAVFLIPLFLAFALRVFGNLFPETAVISDEECLAMIESSIQKTTGLRDTLEEHYVFQEYEWIDAFLKNEEYVKIIGNILRKDANLLLSPEDIRYYMRVWYFDKCR